MKKRLPPCRLVLVLSLPLAFIPCMLAVASCGSSSSETPWPAEPESPALGPSGENPEPAPLEAPDGGESQKDD